MSRNHVSAEQIDNSAQVNKIPRPVTFDPSGIAQPGLDILSLTPERVSTGVLVSTCKQETIEWTQILEYASSSLSRLCSLGLADDVPNHLYDPLIQMW